MRAFLNAATFQRAAVFMGIFNRIISPGAHFMPRFTKWMAFLAESDVIRGVFRRFCPAVDVNQRIHVPVFQQFISRDIVMCRVEADIFWRKAKNIAPEIINGIEEVLAVMAACAGELHQQGEFDFQRIVPAAEHIQRMPEIPCVVVTVPSPFGIRVGVVAGTAVAVRAGGAAGREVPAEGGGMGNYSGAITGYGKVSRINQAELHGREDCKEGKDLLQGCFRIVRGRFAIVNIVHNVPGGDSAWVFRFHKFAISTDFLFRFLPVFSGREQRGSGIGIPGGQPETVHKVIVRAKRWQFFGGSTANEDGQGNGFGEYIPDP